tara:strand:- start:1356 stop:2384 length:1029 start_codon:yes stop_codon:yes gene_type:complete
MKILVTGGNGFIATNFIKIALDYKHRVTSLDNLSYASSKDNHKIFQNNEMYKFIHEDIRDKKIYETIKNGNYDAVINFAAETHVDRSIRDDTSFMSTNIDGTHNLISICRKLINDCLLPNEFKFIQISTDEVYGSLREDEMPFTERSLLKPSNPYSATKASADLLALSYFKTYKFPVIVTRCSNNYGPYQYPEKLIPLSINKINIQSKIPIYGNGKQIRDWIYVDDHCHGILKALELGKLGEVYNFGGNSEMTNTDCLKLIIKSIDPSAISDEYFEYVADRPGHDIRYAIDSSKSLRDLGWRPLETFKTGIIKTISWYQNNIDWLRTRVNSSEYKNWVAKNY